MVQAVSKSRAVQKYSKSETDLLLTEILIVRKSGCPNSLPDGGRGNKIQNAQKTSFYPKKRGRGRPKKVLIKMKILRSFKIKNLI